MTDGAGGMRRRPMTWEERSRLERRFLWFPVGLFLPPLLVYGFIALGGTDEVGTRYPGDPVMAWKAAKVTFIAFGSVLAFLGSRLIRALHKGMVTLFTARVTGKRKIEDGEGGCTWRLELALGSPLKHLTVTASEYDSTFLGQMLEVTWEPITRTRFQTIWVPGGMSGREAGFQGLAKPANPHLENTPNREVSR